jgi:hypothetical protein
VRERFPRPANFCRDFLDTKPNRTPGAESKTQRPTPVLPVVAIILILLILLVVLDINAPTE